MNLVNTSTVEQVKSVLVATLGIEDRADSVDASTPLLEDLPELDSLAAMELVVALQAHFDITIEDDEVNAETFETLGSLAALIDGRLTADQPRAVPG
jgi:acyl carrier protein